MTSNEDAIRYSKMEKDATLQDALLKALVAVWRDTEGPFENIFRLISYSPVLFAGFGGLILTGLDKIVSYFWKMGLEDFGAWIDRQLGKGPRSEVTQQDYSNLRSLLMQTLESRAAAEGQIVKVAFLGGLFRLFGGAGKIVNALIKFLMRAFAFVALAVGASTTGEIGEKVKKYTKEKAVELAKETIKEQMPEMLLGGQTMGDITDLLGAFEKDKRS